MAKKLSAMGPEKYKAIRSLLNLTQKELGATLGVTGKAIYERETGAATITVEAALAIHFIKEAEHTPSLRGILDEVLATQKTQQE